MFDGVVGTKREVVVRILFPRATGDSTSTTTPHALVKISKLHPWTSEHAQMSDRVISHLLPSAAPLESERADKDWKGSGDGGEVYMGTAIDDSWRAAVGMAGGKPWGGSKRQ